MYKSLEPYAKLVDFLSAALGDNCEIALHDLTSKDQEIVAISNNPISGREVGAKLSNLSLHYLEEKQYLDHDYVMNYKTKSYETKKKLAKILKKLMQEKNFKNISIVDITSLAKVNRKTFYYHFKIIPDLLKWTL